MNFIPGVTLLNMYIVSDNIPIWGGVLIGVLLSFFAWILGYGFSKWYQGLICRVILFIIAWTAMVWLTLYPTYWMNYEVTIDNNVSYVEFTDTYGMNVSRKGEIYTIAGETHHDWLWNMKEYENAELGKLSER